MSLLRLLTAGKSLIGLKRDETRYHLPGEKALPRFGSKKNPFRATVFPEKAESGSTGTAQNFEVANGSGLNGGGESCAAETPSGDATKGNESTTSSIAANTPATASASTPAKAAEPPRKRASALKALLLWGRAKKTGFANRPVGRPLVQGELSLDAVKVVRNDLMESDLEVVSSPRPPASEQSERAPVDAATKLTPAPAAGILGMGRL